MFSLFLELLFIIGSIALVMFVFEFVLEWVWKAIGGNDEDW